MTKSHKIVSFLAAKLNTKFAISGNAPDGAARPAKLWYNIRVEHESEIKRYEVKYIAREGHLATCIVGASDHHEAVRIARRTHDDILRVRRLSSASKQDTGKHKGGGKSVIGVIGLTLSLIAAVTLVGAIVCLVCLK